MTNQMSEAIKQAFGTDPNEAIKVNMREIICPHVEGSTINKKVITLNKWHDGNNAVGWIGYCYTCRKTYYME